MTITIVGASAADLPAILDLLRRNALPPDGLEAHLATTLAARDGARLVGCAALELHGASALLRSVAVDSAHRGQGLGRRLTHHACDLGRARGVRAVYLLTTTAGDFFPKLGFRAITRAEVDPAVRQSVEFTAACPADALVMRRDLAP
jgi:amino-acid N-acetyltransferase